jgi:uncharacterized protein YecE (DUF72 family)
MASKILVGTCGFCCSQKRYFETFPVIEIQQIFYQPPKSALLRGGGNWHRPGLNLP